MWDNNSLDEVQRDLLDKGIIAIGGELEVDAAIYVREALLRLIGKGSPDVEIFITSGGGSVDIGLDIYDFIRYYPGQTTGIVQGYARSMAVVVLQACQKRKSMKHSHILIHHLSRKELNLDTLRDAEKLTAILDDLEKSQQRIFEILSDRTGQSLEEVKQACAKEQDITAQEALEFGLIDEII